MNKTCPSLTIGHKEFGDEVDIPVSTSAHGLWWTIWQPEAFVELQWDKENVF